ncbi:MAG TPA: VanW family protein, partial [Thermomicrobiales bacterium]|nr:VanW family protein [Thermomicrobiales bacterium]
IIAGERIGQDIGGGICQVSTTVFRAALLAGMPILDWWPHQYRLAFYEFDGWTPGLDASILQAGPREDWGDFKFINQTDGWLLVEAYVEGETDVVKIYGPHTGWNVEISDPVYGNPILGDDQPDLEVVDPELDPGTIEQTELRQDGLDVSYHRKVTAPDGTIISDRDFHSVFAARGDVWKVSPDEKGQSPATLDPHKVGSETDSST